MLTMFRYQAAKFLIGIFVVTLVLNVLILAQNYFTRGRSSMIPLFGGVFGAIGFALIDRLRYLCWLPLLIEPSTLLLLLVSPRIFAEIWATSRFNLVARYEAWAQDRHLTLSLFRRGIFVLDFENPRAKTPGFVGWVSGGIMGNWHRLEDRVILRSDEGEAILATSGPSASESLVPSTDFPVGDPAPDWSIGAVIGDVHLVLIPRPMGR